MSNQAIHIPAGPAQQHIVELARTTALGFCSTVETDDDGTIYVVPASWGVDSFSPGERALWQLLESLCIGDLRTVLDLCDTHNLGVAMNVVCRSFMYTMASAPMLDDLQGGGER